jgi:hypothetical protein
MFLVALILNEPLPIRVNGRIFEIVNQLTLLLTLQKVLEVTFTVVFAAGDLGVHSLLDKLKVGLDCVTVIVRGGAPNAVTVIVPVRRDVVVFLAALTLNEPLPIRVIGRVSEIVNQLTLLLTVQKVLDVTFIGMLAADALGYHTFLDSVKVGRACLTVIVRGGAPSAVTVIVPVRWDVVMFLAALTLNEPLPTRVNGRISEIVNQLTLLLTVQKVLDVTFTARLLAAALGAHALLDSVNDGLAGTVTMAVAILCPSLVVAVITAVPPSLAVTLPF